MWIFTIHGVGIAGLVTAIFNIKYTMNSVINKINLSSYRHL
jgi:hypothetical protein